MTKLYLDKERLIEEILMLLDDCPDLDGGDFYTKEREVSPIGVDKGPNTYGGWRVKLDPEMKAYLRGFRASLEHVAKVVQGQGGGTEYGIASGMCPYELEKLAKEKTSGQWYEYSSCECEKCVADTTKFKKAEAKRRAKHIKAGECCCTAPINLYYDEECPLHKDLTTDVSE